MGGLFGGGGGGGGSGLLVNSPDAKKNTKDKMLTFYPRGGRNQDFGPYKINNPLYVDDKKKSTIGGGGLGSN